MSRNCANPLLRDWVKEWMEQSQLINSKAYYTYKKAYDSLDKCTDRFDHPSQAMLLAGIGPGLVARLEESMKKYCKDNGLPPPQRPAKGRKRGTQQLNDIEDTSTPIRKQRAYVPQYRTGGYGILLCLLEFHVVGRENISKEQVCRVAQNFCNSSYTLSDPGKSYTAWSSMKTLIDKGYVYKCGTPARFSLTETGVDIARRLKTTPANSSQAAPSTSTTTAADSQVIESFNRNPSTARSSSRKNARSSSTSDMIDSMLESYPMRPDDVDMSLYVLDPTQHHSISIDSRSNGNSSNSSVPRNLNDDPDILHALAESSRPQKKPRVSRARGGRGRGRGGRKNSGSRTAALLDNLLEGYEEQNSGPDMSQYMLNPSDHRSISISGRTANNNAATSSASTSRPESLSSSSDSRSNASTSNTSNFSSIIDSNGSSFARRVMDATESDEIDDFGGFTDYDDIYSPAASSPNQSSSTQSSYSAATSSGKYRTLASSSILKKFSAPSKLSNQFYDIEDDEDIDLTPSTLPTLKSSQVEMQAEDIVDLLSSPESSQPLRSAAENISFKANFDLEGDYFPVTQAITKKIKEGAFHYTYLNSKNEDVRSIAKAEVTINEEQECIAYRIRFYTSQRSHFKCKNVIKISVDKTHLNCSIGYISEPYGDPVCPGLPTRPLLPLHREEPDNVWPKEAIFVRPIDESSQRSVQYSASSQAPSQPMLSQLASSGPVLSRPAISQPAISQLVSSLPTSSRPVFSQPKPSQTTFSQQSSQSLSQTQTQQNTVDYNQLVDSLQLESISPGEYEIVLILDNREIQMKNSRTYFQRKLAEKGVRCITRALDVGDVIWVARKRNSTGEDQELFLDYIVERKRLDDLVSSIKDGRYVEQKKRLRVSGAEKVIYVVEEYSREDAIRFGLQAVQTAMSSLQIVEGFYLRRTDSVDETIDFLISATKIMNRIYQNTTLYSIPVDIVTRQNYLDLKKAFRAKAERNSILHKSAYLIKYPLFAELNTKNGSTTVGEVYMRMLMTIRGVNAERAMSLSKIYPTPHALLKAFQGKTVEEGKKLAKYVTRNHISRRRWGNAASEQLYNIWGAESYPNPEEDN
ncbi:hypothetical protein BDF21DRAFT_494981 [Thamnidium elegans]|nr:hypothetical protein BDF21DRAFT_494981 [Thamnidium elegans]